MTRRLPPTDELHHEFEHATESPQTMATFLRWSGIALVGIAAVIIFIDRQSA